MKERVKGVRSRRKEKKRRERGWKECIRCREEWNGRNKKERGRERERERNA